MITAENLALHEFIGLDVEIIHSSNAQQMGMKGRIVDETKFVLVLSSENEIKKLPKENAVWRFFLGNNKIDLNGNVISKRSFERLGIKT
ncbi:MAG: ribonuclease P protein component 1 [Nitrosopumilaceae archaeon]